MAGLSGDSRLSPLRELVSALQKGSDPAVVLSSLKAWLLSGCGPELTSSNQGRLFALLCSSLDHFVTQGEVLLKLDEVIDCVRAKFPSLKPILLTSVAPSLVRLLVADSKVFRVNRGLRDGPKLTKYRLQLTKVTNSMLTKVQHEHRSRLREENGRLFDAIPSLMSSIGDMDAQIHLTELLFRVCVGQEELKSFGKHWFKAPIVSGLFARISKSAFEVDCRKFLNALNISLGKRAKVHTFECFEILVGKRPLRKPHDEGYQSFWVDFNEGTQSIFVICSIGVGSNAWDACCIEADDITEARIAVDSRIGRQTLLINLSREAYLLFDSSSLTQIPGVEVKITFDSGVPLYKTLKKVFGDRICLYQDEKTEVLESSQCSEDLVTASQTVQSNFMRRSFTQRVPISDVRPDVNVAVSRIDENGNKTSRNCTAISKERDQIMASSKVPLGTGEEVHAGPSTRLATLVIRMSNKVAQEESREAVAENVENDEKVVAEPEKDLEQSEDDERTVIKSPCASQEERNERLKTVNKSQSKKRRLFDNDSNFFDDPLSQEERGDNGADGSTRVKQADRVGGKMTKLEVVPSFAEAHGMKDLLPKNQSRKPRAKRTASTRMARGRKKIVVPGEKHIGVGKQPWDDDGGGKKSSRSKDLGLVLDQGGTVEKRKLRGGKRVRYTEQKSNSLSASEVGEGGGNEPKNEQPATKQFSLYSDFSNSESDDPIGLGFRSWRNSKVVKTYQKQDKEFKKPTVKELESKANGQKQTKKAKPVQKTFSDFGFSSEGSSREALRDDSHSFKTSTRIECIGPDGPSQDLSDVDVVHPGTKAPIHASPRVVLENILTPTTRCNQTPMKKVTAGGKTAQSHVKKQLFGDKSRGTRRPRPVACSPKHCESGGCCLSKLVTGSSCLMKIFREMVAEEVRKKRATNAPPS